MSKRPTIYEVLKARLGREPTNAELKAEVRRILDEGVRDMAERGKMQHQRRRKNPAKRASKKSYVSRPSQITKRAPSKRLRKRRTKNVRAPKKGFFPNPAPLRYIITARSGKGPRMHYDGTKFSQRQRVTLFSSVERANAKALELLRRFPILRRYQIRIESNRPH